jgi:hypothetical protein
MHESVVFMSMWRSIQQREGTRRVRKERVRRKGKERKGKKKRKKREEEATERAKENSKSNGGPADCSEKGALLVDWLKSKSGRMGNMR